MSISTFQEMWSHYLFNQKSPIMGDGLLDESLIRDNTLKESSEEKGVYYETDTPGDIVKISASDFMTKGAGKYVNGANFGVINNFFEPTQVEVIADVRTLKTTLTTAYLKEQIQENNLNAIDEDGTIRLSLKQVLVFNEKLLLSNPDPDNPNKSKGISQRQYSPDGEPLDEFAERVQLFESTSFQLGNDLQGYDENMQFIIHPDGTREIKNFVIVPQADNFDFVGGNGEGLQAMGNQLSEFISDPSTVRAKEEGDEGRTYGIGRTVPIEYTNPELIDTVNYTLEMFKEDKQELQDNNFLELKTLKLSSPLDSLILATRTLKVLLGTLDIYQELYDSNITSFKDDENRTIYYGTNKSDTYDGVDEIDLDKIQVQDYNLESLLDSISIKHPTLFPMVQLVKLRISLPEGEESLNEIENIRLKNIGADSDSPITYVAGSGDDVIKGLDKAGALIFPNSPENNDRIFGGTGDEPPRQ